MRYAKSACLYAYAGSPTAGKINVDVKGGNRLALRSLIGQSSSTQTFSYDSNTIFLLWQGMSGVDGPPEVHVSVDRVTAQADGFDVGFEARNDGAAPAMALTVEAVLTMPGGRVERLETVLDYLPAHSARRGGFVFSADPRQGRLEIRAVSYQEP